MACGTKVEIGKSYTFRPDSILAGYSERSGKEVLVVGRDRENDDGPLKAYTIRDGSWEGVAWADELEAQHEH